LGQKHVSQRLLMVVLHTETCIFAIIVWLAESPAVYAVERIRQQQ